jgi:hypothetical protein
MCNKVSIILTIKTFAILQYLPNNIYIACSSGQKKQRWNKVENGSGMSDLEECLPTDPKAAAQILAAYSKFLLE